MSEAEIIKNTENGPITVESIKKDLNSLGVVPGMNLLVHSALSKLGWVNGGPVAVIQALGDVLGPEGTLIMPTFTGDYSDPEGWKNPPVPEDWKDTIRQTMPAYDPDLTPTRGMGKISETFRKAEGVLRSYHPQVSFAACGKNAELITRDHQLDFGLGDNSPLGKLYELDGWILLIGVKHENNTSLHLAEFRAEFPGKRIDLQGAPVIVDGKKQWVNLKDIDEHSEEFSKLGKDYQNNDGTHYLGKIGNAESVLIPHRDLIDYAVTWMEMNYDYSMDKEYKRGE